MRFSRSHDYDRRSRHKPAPGSVSRDTCIEATATAATSSPYITLKWPAITAATGTIHLYRRINGATSWGTVTDIATTSTTYADTTALPGVGWSTIDPLSAANQLSVQVDTPATGLQTIVGKDSQPITATSKRFMRLRVSLPKKSAYQALSGCHFVYNSQIVELIDSNKSATEFTSL